MDVLAVQRSGRLQGHDLEHRLRARAAQQEAIARLELDALKGRSVDQLLLASGEAVANTLQADLCEVRELTDDGAWLVLTAGVGWRPGLVGHDRIGLDVSSQIGYTVSVDEPVLVPNHRHEARFVESALLRSHGVISSASVAMRDQDRPVGALAAHTRRRRVFTSDDIHFLQAIANLLAIMRRREAAEAERNQVLERSRLAVAARDRAVGIISHDLGNPLSTIEICAQALLEREPPTVAGMRQMADIVQRAAAWMKGMVGDLLDRASLDSGQLVLDRRPTVVTDVIGAAQAMFAPVAEEEDIDFVVETSKDLPPVYADPRRLLQVLSNLLGNAMKFTPSGGRVLLSARAGASNQPGILDRTVSFLIGDTGPGIPAEDVGHVFDWYWRSESASDKGTGMGLAIAHGLVEAHGGRLQVESVVGRGTSFRFALPGVPESA